jgi:hypothetical protein
LHIPVRILGLPQWTQQVFPSLLWAVAVAVDLAFLVVTHMEVSGHLVAV